MIFSLDVRRARKGDCLLLHCGSRDNPGLVMIDGGPTTVYDLHLKPRLEEIRKARKLRSNQPLPVDLLMVSHVDDDHLRGVLDFTRELQGARGVPAVRVASLWHNSFDDIIGNTPDELTAAMTGHFATASIDGDLSEDATVDADEDEEVIVSSLKVLASIKQGQQLRGAAEDLGFERNPEFGGGLILAGTEDFTVAEGVTFRVAGPMQPELLALQQKHDEFLRTQRERPRSGESALAAYIDKSVPNLSSIVVLARAGRKSMLLTGDARGDKILEGLELAGLLKPGKTLHVDVLKVPHHGSTNNVERDFFTRITADHYVFSGNGQHGNPERETFTMLLEARGSDGFELHLTYPIDEIDAARTVDWENEQAKERAKKARGTRTKDPRPDWSARKHSLAAFFAGGRLASGQTMQIADEKKPHVIDLLDELRF
jgi:hypothetical protein